MAEALPNEQGIRGLLRTHYRPHPGYQDHVEPERILIDAIERTVYRAAVAEGRRQCEASHG